MTRLLLFIVVCLGLLPMSVQAQKNAAFIPGEVWKDTRPAACSRACRGTFGQ